MNRIAHKILKSKEYKKCKYKNHWVLVSNFSKNKNSWDALDAYCLDCKREYNRALTKNRTEEKRAKDREKSLRYQRKNRDKFLDMYGHACACCGETLYEFLTIEHKLGQVGNKKKEIGDTAYRKAIQEYRPDLYEVLCYNCNCTKGRYGYCPHQKH